MSKKILILRQEKSPPLLRHGAQALSKGVQGGEIEKEPYFPPLLKGGQGGFSDRIVEPHQSPEGGRHPRSRIPASPVGTAFPQGDVEPFAKGVKTKWVRFRKIFPLTILIFVLTAQIFAYTNLGVLNFGDPYYTGGKGTALGLTSYSSAKDASAVFYNPAAMDALTDIRILISLPMVSVSERVIPDSDWSGYEGGAYYNTKLYVDIPDFAIVYPFSRKIKLGFGVTQRQNFRYKHTKDYSSGGTYLDFEGKNNIKGYDFAGAINLLGNWSLGFGYEMLSGKPTFKQDLSGGTFVTMSDYDYSGDRTFYSLRKSGGMWNISFSYFNSAKLDYNRKYTVTVGTQSSSSVNYKGSVDFPKTIALGFNHVWGGAVSASLYFDIVKTFWSDTDLTYKDKISFHLGIENDLSSRLQLRYGMAFIPSYEKSYVERAFLTAGFGYYLSSSLNLDFGFAYGKRAYLNDWDGGGISYSGRLDETMQIINISLDWKL